MWVMRWGGGSGDYVHRHHQAGPFRVGGSQSPPEYSCAELMVLGGGALANAFPPFILPCFLCGETFITW